MRLFYFTSERFGLEAIRDRRLKIAIIDQLNDPFEFIGLVLTERNERRAWANLKQTMSRRFGIICMSSSWHHPLLWSHYADKHQGICLGFDVPDHLVTEIQYVDDRITLQRLGKSSISELTEHDMRRVLFTKFKSWEYESEYRVFCSLERSDPVSDLHFRSFHPDFELKEVLVGERSGASRARVNRVLDDLGGTVRAFKVRAGFKRFEVVENMRRTAWK